jgi:signal transduction histidine kinase
LPVALRWYVQGLAERSGLSINVDIPEDLGRFPHEMELMIFRLVQECLTNIHRHSGSKTAEIRIWRAANNVILEVQDEGKGIPANRLAEIQAHGAGVGIRGMRERIRRFEGQMEISSDESGTTVSFKFPVPKSSSSPVRNSSGVQIPA